MQQTIKLFVGVVSGPAPTKQPYTIPIGTRVKPADGGGYFVDDMAVFSNFDKHDAEHYGFRVPSYFVDGIEPDITPEPKELAAILSGLGVTIEADFVPASTFKGDEWRSQAINHRVRLLRYGRLILETNYSQGEAHLPCAKGRPFGARRTVDYADAVAKSIETGMDYRPGQRMSFRKLPAPPLPDVFHSILMDTSGDLADFNEWAAEYGYSDDSIKARQAFDTCRDFLLKLQGAFSPQELEELRELFSQY